ncbi:hypothetical protein I3842_01G074700 [Carya illinoinensis]|uniref:Uncharacterized protein n=1 Tax=Carya illinoinensis TaxID=32201 RepID=A0A922G0W9_CARIL|nr:hypothetical protein I3842_06G075100 [Carya illinoinensis]KAG6730337.1 hypothetical protein I3842_01G074700 [Carya illinoinensis]
MSFSFLKFLINNRHTTILYAYGLATRRVHYPHQPWPLFQREIGQDKAYINETLFTLFFVSFILLPFQCIDNIHKFNSWHKYRRGKIRENETVVFLNCNLL